MVINIVEGSEKGIDGGAETFVDGGSDFCIVPGLEVGWRESSSSLESRMNSALLNCAELSAVVFRFFGG